MGIEEEVWGWEDVYNSFIAKIVNFDKNYCPPQS